MKKILRAAIIGLCAFVFALTLLWTGVIYYVIPRIALPMARDYINENVRGPFRVHIGGIGFNFLTGFSVRDVVVSGASGGAAAQILHASSVYIDLVWSSLLRKRIEITKLEVRGADLSMSRDKKGMWNFQPVAYGDVLKLKRSGGFDIVIQEVRLANCRMLYTDVFDKNNALTRVFSNVNLCVTHPEERRYLLTLSGRAQEHAGETIDLRAVYNAADDSLKGRVRLSTPYLKDYWGYYLDEMVRPWKLWADNVTVEIDVAVKDGKTDLGGRCVVDNGTISYGTTCLQGDAVVVPKLSCTGNTVDVNSVSVDLSSRNMSLSAGSTVLFSGGCVKAFLTKDAIAFEELSGTAGTVHVAMKGQFSSSPMPSLRLRGAIGCTQNDFLLVVMPGDRGRIDGESSFRSSSVKLHVDIQDLTQLLLSVKSTGTFDLEDMLGLVPSPLAGLSGKVSYDADIRGRLSDLPSMTGSLSAVLHDLSFFGTKLSLARLDLVAKDGEFRGDIPETAFGAGTLSGRLRMDYNRWGVEGMCAGVDIRRPAAFVFKEKNVTGICSARGVCIGTWGSPEDARGGGYFTLIDSNLWGIPLFYATEKGIEQIKKDFSASVFQQVTGTFRIEQRSFVLDKVVCKGSVININVNGRVAFSGVSNFTAVAQFLESSSFLRTLRYIILPKSIILDIIQDALQMKINGTWPDLSCHVSVQPLAFIHKVFAVFDGWEKERYHSLDELWVNGEKK